MDNQYLHKQLMITRLIYGSVIFSFGIFWFIANQKVSAGPVDPDMMSGNSAMMKQIFWMVSGVTTVASLILKGPMLQMMLNQKKSDNVSEEQFVANALHRASIVVMGLCEIPILLGMVLAIQSNSMNEFYTLGALSTALVVLHFPKRLEWEEILKG